MIAETTLLRLPAVQKALAQEHVDAVKRRAAAAEAIAQIAAERAAVTPALIEARNAAKAEFGAATKAMLTAQEKYRKANSAVGGAGLRADAQMAPHLRLLRDTADPRIAELLDKLVYRKGGYTSEVSQAINTLRELWREPLTTEEVTERLASIVTTCDLESE